MRGRLNMSKLPRDYSSCVCVGYFYSSTQRVEGVWVSLHTSFVCPLHFCSLAPFFKKCCSFESQLDTSVVLCVVAWWTWSVFPIVHLTRRWRRKTSCFLSLTSLTLGHTCSSDNSALSIPADVRHCNGAPHRARVVYLRLVPNVSPASFNAVTLLGRRKSVALASRTTATTISVAPAPSVAYIHADMSSVILAAQTELCLYVLLVLHFFIIRPMLF